MQDVADRAKVSIATVSFVVNNTKRVSPATKQRVLDAIDHLGFERNANARALASRKSHVIALLYPLAERNLSAFVEGAATTAAERGYKLVLWPVGENPRTEVSSLIAGRLADGVLLMEVQLDDERVMRLREEGSSFVLIGRTRDPSQLTYVDVAFERTASAAISHLEKLGHTHLALVLQQFDYSGLSGYAPPVRVEEAFREVISTGPLHGAIFRCVGDPAAGRALAAEILRTAPDTTGLILMNDDASLGLIRGLRALGKQVPADISVISIGSDRMASMSDPILTRLVPPGEELGRAASEALIDRLEGLEAEPVQLLIDCDLHPGASTAPAPSTEPTPSR